MVLLLLFGCASTTMEFTSAKTYVRTDKDLRKGEEWALKALNIPSDSANALVPYFLATEIYKPQEEWEKMKSDKVHFHPWVYTMLIDEVFGPEILRKLK